MKIDILCVILDNFPFIYFNCTFLTGMCICIKNGPSVLHKYLQTYYDVRFEFVYKNKITQGLFFQQQMENSEIFVCPYKMLRFKQITTNDKMYFYNCVSYATELCVIPNFPQKSFRSPAFILYETIE